MIRFTLLREPDVFARAFLLYNILMKFKKFFLLVPLLFLPYITFAHVKWFAEQTTQIPAYKITDKFVVLAIIASIILVLIGIFLEKRLHMPKFLDKYIERFAPGALSIASVGFGFAFLLFTLKGFIFAPNLLAVGDMGSIMLLVQGVAGAMILFGFYERLGGFLLVILFILGVQEYGAYEMLDTFEMLGFAFYAIIIGRPKWSLKDASILKNFRHRFRSYGLPILRVGTGLNLIILGFTEKILTPSLTANFLENYNWNFMQKIGIYSVTDYWFAFFAGVVEILFGIFFLLGLVTRTTTVVLAIFLVTTLVLLGPIELVGHLPHFSIAIVLFVLGSGSRLKLIKND